MKKITKEELNKILENHKIYLSDGHKGEKANLNDVDLTNMCLANVNLKLADLRGAILKGVSLMNSDLSYADLRQADLSNTYLDHTNLTGADLNQANLSHTSLRHSNLNSSNLRGANLSFVNLNDADLSSADLQGANLQGILLACAVNLNRAVTDKEYLQVSGTGSRGDTTIYCIEDRWVWCGCWNKYSGGSLKEFKERVEKIYGENGQNPNSKYYGKYIRLIKYLKKESKNKIT